VETANKVGDGEMSAIKPASPENIVQVIPPQRQSPVQVFVSRKQGKVFVRQDFKPIFEAPVTIAEPDRPLGTHVFTAMQMQEDGAAMQWTAVTIPRGYARARDTAATAAAPTAAAAPGRLQMPPKADGRTW